ncbi:MAG: efflux RND transporter periplasmic adaptor subunit [Deltaproteobacteria bacterium]|nr:efflux RND transporter periplasmic adaptor subunit [Deltaproteobacteria bacterium]
MILFTSWLQRLFSLISISAVSLVLLAAMLFLSACSGGKEPPKQEAVPVVVATVEQRDVPVEIKNIGAVEAYATVGIKSRVGGQLVRVNFQEGQDVEAKQLLFVIDPRPYETASQQAQANLAKDRALFNKAAADARRYAELIRKQFVSQQEYDQAKATADSLAATVKADEVAVQNAKLNLSYCYINAPISGRTGNLLANMGNMIKADADNPMVVITQVQPIYVSFAVPQQYLPDLRKYMDSGQVKVEVAIGGDMEHPTEGVLTFVNNTVDQATGTIQCKATFPNLERRLWPGQFVNVVVKLTTEPNAVLAPTQAIQTGQEGQIVWVITPDLTAEVRPVEIKRVLNSETIIKKGLQPGERVVTDGQIRLVPGAKVEIKSGS